MFLFDLFVDVPVGERNYEESHVMNEFLWNYGILYDWWEKKTVRF